MVWNWEPVGADSKAQRSLASLRAGHPAALGRGLQVPGGMAPALKAAGDSEARG